MDPFSPQSQNQLAEFDVLRNQIETKDPAEQIVLRSNSFNGRNEGRLSTTILMTAISPVTAAAVTLIVLTSKFGYQVVLLCSRVT